MERPSSYITEVQEHLDALKLLYQNLEGECARMHAKLGTPQNPAPVLGHEPPRNSATARSRSVSFESVSEDKLRVVLSGVGGSASQSLPLPPDHQDDDLVGPDSLSAAQSFTSRGSGRRCKPEFSTLVPETVIGKQSSGDCETSAAIFERTLVQITSAGPSDCGVLSPVSRVRLAWDALMVTILAYELWSLPVITVFYNDTNYPAVLDTMGWASALFFALDIVMNFNTGYIDHHSRPVMLRRKIFKKYIKFWFWLDLLAAVPFDNIHNELYGDGTTLVRGGRILKLLQRVRYFRLLRTARLMRVGRLKSEPLWNCLEVYGLKQKLYVCSQVVLALCWLSHFLGCAWALARRSNGDAFNEAPFRDYYESFWWAFVNIAGGVLGAPSWVSGPSVWTMDLVLVCVRLVLIVLGVKACVICAMAHDTSQSTAKDRALEYFRKHNVRYAARLKVLQCIKETGKVNKMQQSFHELMSNAMPPTVRGMILEELWTERLISFQLFRPLYEWAPDLIRDIALQVSEEVLGTHVILFREGEKATAAYRILTGSIKLSTKSHTPIPDFTEGMWVGETVLLNPLLLRSASAVTQTVTTLMVVPGDAFQKSLIKWGLNHRLHNYCKRHLWKGLCARCGTMGNHWSAACPTILQETGVPPPSLFRDALRLMKSKSSESLTSQDVPAAAPTAEASEPLDDGCAELSKFLACQDMEFLIPQLNEREIFTLDELRVSDLDSLNDFFRGELEGTELEIFEKHAFAEETFGDFYQSAEASVSELLHFGMERSQHLLFLSHAKAEAGTEAALILSEIVGLLSGSPDHAGNRFDVPVFLDSENLRNLGKLCQHVRQSHNLVVLLTENILTRAWCLVEIVTAAQEGVTLVPVLLEKPGQKGFTFPDDAFYQQLSAGKLLTAECRKVLDEFRIKLPDLCRAIQEVFKVIALRYAPHAPAGCRLKMAQMILDNCKITKHRQ